MAYITIDFGSSNSGALLNTASGKEYNPADLIYIHRDDGDGGITKQPTVFWIKRSLLEKSSVSEKDIKVYSTVFYDEDINFVNFIWCKKQIKKALPRIVKNREWVCIQYPKMELYKVDNYSPADTLIKAIDGSQFLFQTVLKIFFMVIKKECLHRASKASLSLDVNDINWGITVPGLAIWNQKAVGVMKKVVNSVFGEKITLWSEPECAIIGVNLSGRSEIDFVENRYSLVVDLGGGTADICVMQENLNSDGTTTFDEVKSTIEGKDSTTSERVGGNDIDRNFKAFFCRNLVKGEMVEDTPLWLYQDFLKENPIGAMAFDEKWQNLHFKGDIEEDIIYFEPGRAYKDWLKIHYPKALKQLDEWGMFSFDGAELREFVFEPVFDKIITSIEENLSVLKQKQITLDAIYFAGGLSLNKLLIKRIKSVSIKYFPYVKFIEASEGSVVGAVQRGGNHIAANKETLVRRMARKTFYVEFAEGFNGDMSALRNSLNAQLLNEYHKRGIRIKDSDIDKKLEEQWGNKCIDYAKGMVLYLSPFCLRFAPVTQKQSFEIAPFNLGNQTAVNVKIYSSEKSFVFFKDDNVKYEGEINYDFGYNWESAELVFDPCSNAVEGVALFYIADGKGNKQKEIEIKNVSKRGI